VQSSGRLAAIVASTMDTKIAEVLPWIWWVRTILALVVALLATWLLKRASPRLARTSAWFRRWNAKGLMEEARYRRALSRSPKLLIMHGIHTLLAFLCFAFFAGMFLLVPVWSNAIYDPSSTFSSWVLTRWPSGGSQMDVIARVMQGLIWVIAVFCLLSGVKAISYALTGARVFRDSYARVMPKQGKRVRHTKTGCEALVPKISKPIPSRQDAAPAASDVPASVRRRSDGPSPRT